MITTVALPSGHNVPLRLPDLRALVEAGDDLYRLVMCVWAHEEIELASPADVARYLDDSDVAYICQWAAEHADEDTLDALAVIASTYRVTPGRYLGISDPAARFAIDVLVAQRVAEREREGGETTPTSTRVVGRMDDPD